LFKVNVHDPDAVMVPEIVVLDPLQMVAVPPVIAAIGRVLTVKAGEAPAPALPLNVGLVEPIEILYPVPAVVLVGIVTVVVMPVVVAVFPLLYVTPEVENVLPT
jgi:hypothetical protein